MKEVILNIESINSKRELHQYLKEIFSFPYYYGGNLDSLYDCLTDIAEPTVIVLPTKEAIYKRLGNYGVMVLKVFKESSFGNNNLILKK